jgi:hypothetical protein
LLLQAVAGWWNESRQALQEIEGRKDELGPALEVGLGESVEEACLGRRERRLPVDRMEPLQGEGPPGAVAHEPLHAGSVVAFHAHGAVHAESSTRLPTEHVGGGAFLEEPAPPEGPQHAALRGLLELLPVLAREEGGLVEADLTRGGLAEDAVRGEHVKILRTAPPTSGSWWRYGRSRLGSESTHCRSGRWGST